MTEAIPALSKPKLIDVNVYKDGKLLGLDLFCCAGGASYGYTQAGFKMVGVDLLPHVLVDYPYDDRCDDVFNTMQRLLDGKSIRIRVVGTSEHLHIKLSDIDFIHASPPCQGYVDNAHGPRWVNRVRKLLVATELPYVIENVDRAPLRDAIVLCGTMVDLAVIRHRLFEVSIDVKDDFNKLRLVCNHVGSVADGTYAGMYGHGGTPRGRWVDGFRGRGVDGSVLSDYNGDLSEWWREASGNYWMRTRFELRESIPWMYAYIIEKLIIAKINA